MVVLVTGGRSYQNVGELFGVLDELHQGSCITKVVHGGASGADSLAGRWANSRGVPVVSYPVTMQDWKDKGKAAGVIRNGLMLQREKIDLVVACPGGTGTADMVRKAKAAGVPVRSLVDSDEAVSKIKKLLAAFGSRKELS
jgi:UDP-N-acetylmuramoylalanine-D-glutamate ligase